MTNSNTVILANSTVCELGEGPVWDPVRQLLLWLDVRRGIVFAGRLDRHRRVELVDETTFEGTVGAVGIAADGSWLIAGAHTLLVHRPQGKRLEVARVIPRGQSRRTNDGKPDPAGRFLIGTLSLDGDSDTEVLVRLEADGSLTTIDDDLTLSNGLAWTQDGRTMYNVDTLRRTIFSRSYDPATGAVGERSVFVQCEDGHPDGLCIDREQHLWVAMWGLGQVHRYTPGGTLDRVLKLPAPHVSSVAFAGPDLDTLVITTATQDLSDEQLAAAPLSGRLFTAAPGVTGAPSPLWNGHVPTDESRKP